MLEAFDGGLRGIEVVAAAEVVADAGGGDAVEGIFRQLVPGTIAGGGLRNPAGAGDHAGEAEGDPARNPIVGHQEAGPPKNLGPGIGRDRAAGVELWEIDIPAHACEVGALVAVAAAVAAKTETTEAAVAGATVGAGLGPQSHGLGFSEHGPVFSSGVLAHGHITRIVRLWSA